MKLRKNAEPSAYVYINGRNEHYELYVENAMTARKTVRPGKTLPTTPDNIGAALFEINKAAKRRRDAATRAYGKRRHGAAGVQKNAKENLYDLKNRVLEKSIANGWAHLVGYHTKNDSRTSRVWKDSNPDEVFPGDEVDHDQDHANGSRGQWIEVIEERQTAMALYELGGFRFHMILDAVPIATSIEITDLGDWLSGATPRTKHMTLKDAEATLDAYLCLPEGNDERGV